MPGKFLPMLGGLCLALGLVGCSSSHRAPTRIVKASETQPPSPSPIRLVDSDSRLGRIDEWGDSTGKIVRIDRVYRTTITCTASQQTFSSGDPVELTIHLENRNQIKQTLGCFAIERKVECYGYRVTRDGELLSPLDRSIQESPSKDEGGSHPGIYSDIPPGGSFDLTLPLSRYFDLTQPGHYKVTVAVPEDWSVLLYPSRCDVKFDVVR